MIPQFVISLCVLSSVIVVSQLVRLSDVLVAFGLSFENILLPFLFIMLPFLGFTIPIAFMFAVLLAFSRLSSDGEFTAMLASGYSLRRALMPVMILGAGLYLVAVYSSIYFEPWGRRETVAFYHRKTQTQLDNIIKFKLKSGVFLNDFLGYVLYAERISADRSEFENVMLAPGLNQESQKFTLLAPEGYIHGSVESGNLRMSFKNGMIMSKQTGADDMSLVKFKQAEIDLLRIFQEQILGPDSGGDDYRSFGPLDLWSFIQEEKTKNITGEASGDLLKAEFLFFQRLALPFSCITFALFAVVLGIGDERRGKGVGYTGAIFTIIVGYVLLMFFKFLAEKGTLSPAFAAFAPNILLLVSGIFLVYQKNRLPPSESTIDPRYIPGRKKIFG